MSENSTCLGSGSGVGPGPTPIDKAQSRLRFVRKAKPAQCEPETGGHLGDGRQLLFGRTLSGVRLHTKIFAGNADRWTDRGGQPRHTTLMQDSS
jgi:hypothetical protein